MKFIEIIKENNDELLDKFHTITKKGRMVFRLLEKGTIELKFNRITNKVKSITYEISGDDLKIDVANIKGELWPRITPKKIVITENDAVFHDVTISAAMTEIKDRFNAYGVWFAWQTMTGFHKVMVEYIEFNGKKRIYYY